MKSRNKDKKTHESLIGKIIYGFLLFMPILAIFVTCAYAIFNKNAYQSYSDEYVESYQKVVSNNQIAVNNTYQIVYNPSITGSYSPTFNISNTNLYELFNIEDKVISTFSVINEPNYARINITFTDNSLLRLDNWNETTNTFYFTLSGSTNFNYQMNMNRSELYQIIFNTEKLDNVFYYSINKVEESPLFNWAENSAIYTGMSATCNTLNITTPFIPLLMTYWLIISVIYILYDIILVILHIFHKKIHQLEDSF